ncbi:hypothetical protein CS542_06170 [Pedobacter sp. IW39]|nr:hypothetical protein CS542_06170 [Pedobacter sp. IW39]
MQKLSSRGGAGGKTFKPRAFKEGSSKEMPRNEGRSYIKKDISVLMVKDHSELSKIKSTSRSTDSRPFRKEKKVLRQNHILVRQDLLLKSACYA